MNFNLHFLHRVKCYLLSCYTRLTWSLLYWFKSLNALFHFVQSDLNFPVTVSLKEIFFYVNGATWATKHAPHIFYWVNIRWTDLPVQVSNTNFCKVFCNTHDYSCLHRFFTSSTTFTSNSFSKIVLPLFRRWRDEHKGFPQHIHNYVHRQ